MLCYSLLALTWCLVSSNLVILKYSLELIARNLYYNTVKFSFPNSQYFDEHEKRENFLCCLLPPLLELQLPSASWDLDVAAALQLTRIQ